MKILVIDEWIPWPLESGKKIRTFNLMTRLAKYHDIHYLAYVDPKSQKNEIKVMEENGISVIPVNDTRSKKWTFKFYCQVAINLFSKEPFSTSYHIKDDLVRELKSHIINEKPDLIHCEWTNLAPILAYVKDIPCIISAHNVESDIWKRFSQHGSNIIKRGVGYSQARKLERLERKWYPKVDRCIAVSPDDQKVIESYGAKVSLVDNGVDIGFYDLPQGKVDEKSIIFTASFDTFSNQDGAVYFVEDIYPLVKRNIPNINLWLVGKEPPFNIRSFALKDPTIHVAGTVDDVRQYIQQSSVCIVPLRIGGGSRLKILEAFAMKKPVVSTTVGAEGLMVTHEENILIADTPQVFSDCVSKCIADISLRESLSKRGFELVKDRYDWDMLAEMHNKIWEESVIK